LDKLSDQFSHQSPYISLDNSPVLLSDPSGLSTNVVKNKNGTYKVVGGKPYDGDNGIYIVNSENKRIGGPFAYSATPHSFYFSDSEKKKGDGKGTWHGTINLQDQSGRNFLNNQILKQAPGVLKYMLNARNGKKLDFKTTNGKDKPIYKSDDLEAFYRGMPILGTYNGKPIVASARDIGNIAAGFIAGRNGMGWSTARLGFDGYQSYASGKGFSSESSGTKYAERIGWNIGSALYYKIEVSRLPSNGHYRNVTVPNTIIKKNDYHP